MEVEGIAPFRRFGQFQAGQPLKKDRQRDLQFEARERRAREDVQARLRELFDIVCYNDIRRWGEEFLAGVQLQQEPEPLTLVS